MPDRYRPKENAGRGRRGAGGSGAVSAARILPAFHLFGKSPRPGGSESARPRAEREAEGKDEGRGRKPLALNGESAFKLAIDPSSGGRPPAPSK